MLAKLVKAYCKVAIAPYPEAGVEGGSAFKTRENRKQGKRRKKQRIVLVGVVKCRCFSVKSFVRKASEANVGNEQKELSEANRRDKIE